MAAVDGLREGGGNVALAVFVRGLPEDDSIPLGARDGCVNVGIRWTARGTRARLVHALAVHAGAGLVANAWQPECELYV